MKKENFYYNSSDNITKIHAIKWIPDGEIKGIIQIAHGMLEHIKRYDDFGRYFASSGFLVAGNDHLGHGDSVHTEEDRGFFSEKDGNSTVLSDIYKLRTILEKEYGNIPYIILGHSMGSFLTRQYITLYSKGITGVIIVGTGQHPYVLVKFGLITTKIIAYFKGWRHRSKFVNQLAIGNNNAKFEPSRTNVDWLSKDEKKVDEYVADDKINFIFTLNAYYNMFKGIISLYDKNNLNKVPKNLSVIFLAGKVDPVGSFGKGVIKVYNIYKDYGIKDVSYKLYDNDRHEILNETDREKIYKDIKNWILKRI